MSLNGRYHKLTHELGEAIVESLGEDVAAFREYFDFENPDLAASLIIITVFKLLQKKIVKMLRKNIRNSLVVR
jgi:hypothetical protein